MTDSRAGFTPLRDFWADYTRTQPAADEETVNTRLDELFGSLTKHRFSTPKTLPVTSVCESCLNNTEARDPAVCETHVGAIRGLLEATVQVPLEVTYAPIPRATCTISAALGHGPDGSALVPWGRRAAWIRLDADDRSRAVFDERSAERYEVPHTVFRVLSVLGEPATVPRIVSETALSPAEVVSILDTCYQSGWVECSFQPADRPPV